MSHTERPTRSRATRPTAVVLIGTLVVIAAWLVIGAIGGQYLGKLSGLQKNDNLSFLPGSAESTQVAQRVAEIAGEGTLPLIVVAARPEGLTEEDTALGQQLAQEIPGLEIEIGGEQRPVSDYLASPELAVVPSQDGKAFLITVPLESEPVSRTVDDDTPLQLITDRLHVAVTDELESAGLEAHVTGPAGFVADLVTAFAGIDGVLVLVALGVVLVILLVVYRSPVLPFAVLLNSVFALAAAGAVVYALADAGTITVSGQSQGILSILVVGASTDYALLFVSRYKEGLHDEASPWRALLTAWRGTVEPIVASALTVSLGLLMLTFADLKSTSGLGPVGALGILSALIASLTLLPALLVLGGRWIFWPAVPRLDHVHREEMTGGRFGWGAVARLVGRRPRLVWVVTVLVLGAAAAALPTLKTDGIAQKDLFLNRVDSVAGQDLLARHFDAGAGSPVQVVVPEAKADAVLGLLSADPDLSDPYVGLAPGAPATAVDGDVLVQATLKVEADSAAAADVVERLRGDLDAVSPEALVGGSAAETLDVRTAADRDLLVVIPLIIGVVFLVLCLLLRALVAPLVLVAANIASFGATMGISALLFNHVFDFPGGDPTTLLFGFVFLVALGVDYSIFLMSRAREETATRRALGETATGSRRGMTADQSAREGMLHALRVTGGVITSAGIVLAATFGALTVIPLLFLAQIAFIVAFGVLLDTFVVRSLLVPAFCVDLGRRTWWPGRLSRSS